MWLTELEVKNYKSIEEIDISFTNGINVIFGENGTGKTNIIKSILKILGPTYPGPNSFQKEDYFCLEQANEIFIKTTFQFDRSQPTIEWKKDHRDKFRLCFNGFEYINSEERESFCPLHIPPNREIRDLPGSSKWTPIGRIIFELSKMIEKNTTIKTQFIEKMNECVSILRNSDEFSSFKENIEEYSKEQMGSRGENVQIEIDLIDHKYILKTLQIFEILGQNKYNITDGGQGIQSNVTIAALRAFSNISGGKFFILIDEPEAYLHPLAQKALCQVLEKIAENGTQIIITTHSPYFISPNHLKGLTKVWINEGSTKCIKLDISNLVEKRLDRGIESATIQSTESRLQKMMNLDVREGLFAKKIVLCEGESESFSLEIWAEKEGISLSKLGIAIVPSNGKFSMIDLAEFYESMNIPVYLIFDSDGSERDRRTRENHAKNNKWLLSFANTTQEEFPESVVNDLYCVMSPDLESVLKNEDPRYNIYENEVNDELGLIVHQQKGIRARYVAQKYFDNQTPTPPTILSLLSKIGTFE